MIPFFIVSGALGHRVVSPAMEGMTSENPSQGVKNSPARAVFLHCLVRVGRAGRHISAAGREMGRNGTLIKTDGFTDKPQ